MPSLNMIGPFDFNEETINSTVDESSIGNYAIGYLDDKNTFIVRYVGRATDQPLRERLKQHIGEHSKTFKVFKYSYASSKKEAYFKECRNYHDFGGKECLYNEYHPAKLEDDDTPCPVCGE